MIRQRRPARALSSLIMHSAFVQDLIDVLDWVERWRLPSAAACWACRSGSTLFGVLFLSFVVAVVGGMVRDVLIGAVPPVAITELHYFAHLYRPAGLLTFYWYPKVAIDAAPRSCCSTPSGWLCSR